MNITPADEIWLHNISVNPHKLLQEEGHSRREPADCRFRKDDLVTLNDSFPYEPLRGKVVRIHARSIFKYADWFVYIDRGLTIPEVDNCDSGDGVIGIQVKEEWLSPFEPVPVFSSPEHALEWFDSC